MKTKKSRKGKAGSLLFIALCSLFLAGPFFACEQAQTPELPSQQGETPPGKEETPEEESPQEPDPDSIAVNSAEDMAKIGNDPDWPLTGSYRLAADIVLENWTPIGLNAGSAFAGTFHGDNKTIAIKSFDAEFVNANSNLGIFAYIKGSGAAAKAQVRNLKVHAELDYSHLPADKKYNAGALAGTAGAHTEINAVTLTGTLSFSGGLVYIGGLAGVLDVGELRNSKSSATVNVASKEGPATYSRTGALVGLFQGGASIVNCHTTGDVTAVTAGTNTMAGGIAGGSDYGFITGYQGKIEDCSSTGNVTASGGAYWSWAGGIAGCICGDGDGYPDNTRIVRCYATGTITARGSGSVAGTWPYVGGIVGYNYYGGMVSRCYFTGTVNGENGYDYTGGIAGYNSRLAGHNSVIEDCWSSGTVNGRINGGGIVGQNQVETYLRRCYSTAVINLSGAAGERGNASSDGAGGIAGVNQSSLSDAVTACVALNPSITTAGYERVHRVVGAASGNQYVSGSGTQTNNLAWDGMVITVGGVAVSPDDAGINGMDGQATTQKPDISVYRDLGWNFNSVWKMGGGGYPVLRWQE